VLKMPLTVKSIKGLIYHNVKNMPNKSYSQTFIYNDLKNHMASIGICYENINDLPSDSISTAYNYLQSKLGTDYFKNASKWGDAQREAWEENNAWRIEADHEDRYGIGAF